MFLYRLLGLLGHLVQLYEWVVIASAVFSWLIAFNVVNPYNQLVRSFWQGLLAVTEPLLRPIRRVLPDLGGIDLSPLVLIIACWAIRLVAIPSLQDLLVPGLAR